MTQQARNFGSMREVFLLPPPSVSPYLERERVGGKQARVLLNTRLKQGFLAAVFRVFGAGAVVPFSLRDSSPRNAGNAGRNNSSEQRRWYMESEMHR